MRHRKNIFRDKSFIVMAGVSVLALVGIGAGMLIQNNTKEPESGYISDLNGNRPSGNSGETIGSIEKNTTGLKPNIAVGNGAKKDNSSETTTEEATTANNTEETTTGASQAASNNEETSANTGSSEAGIGVSDFHFSAGSKLVWPVETNDIIIDFSPDSTVYFATLDKYKTHDSVCIRSEIGTPVYAAAPGTISDIGYNEEIGNSVSLDLGDGYTLQYGQIKDIQVDKGDVVAEGDLLCYVANPTKYYSVEGSNLYLKLTKGEAAIDPLDYLDYK